MGNTIESEHLSELTEEEYEAQYIKRQNLKGFMRLDVEYLNPFFTRRLTQEDLHDGRIQMKTLTNKWYEEVRQGPSGSEDDEQELLQQSGAGARWAPTGASPGNQGPTARELQTKGECSHFRRVMCSLCR